MHRFTSSRVEIATGIIYILSQKQTNIIIYAFIKRRFLINIHILCVCPFFLFTTKTLQFLPPSIISINTRPEVFIGGVFFKNAARAEPQWYIWCGRISAVGPTNGRRLPLLPPLHRHAPHILGRPRGQKRPEGQEIQQDKENPAKIVENCFSWFSWSFWW